jgi:hypothetical protein
VTGFLQYLLVRGSKLTGTVPTGLCLIVELQKLDVSYTGIGGDLPTEIGDLPNLKEVYYYLQGTSIVGNLDGQFLLGKLSICGCRLRGVISRDRNTGSNNCATVHNNYYGRPHEHSTLLRERLLSKMRLHAQKFSQGWLALPAESLERTNLMLSLSSSIASSRANP